MGKINDMQKNQTNISIRSIKDKQTEKPKLKIKGFKDIATLLGPNAKKYRLSKNQRNFQLKGRITIAAIAAAIGISGAALINHHNSVPTNNLGQTEMSLQKDTLLSEANEKLFDIVYGTDREEAQYFVDYDKITDDNSKTLSVGRNIKPSDRALEYETQINYSYNNNALNFKDAKEIKNLADKMIDIHYSENPSQKDLEKLDEAIEALEDKDFKLDGKNIVPVKEHDTELER